MADLPSKLKGKIKFKDRERTFTDFTFRRKRTIVFLIYGVEATTDICSKDILNLICERTSRDSFRIINDQVLSIL